MSIRKRIKGALTVRNALVRVGLAEFLGTFLLVVIGDGSVAQSVLSRGTSGEFLSINLAWGWGAAMGVWASGAVSGGHLNPAVSLLQSILGRLSWKRLPVYALAQYLGALAGAACVFGIYYDALENFDPAHTVVGANATAGIFATYPAPKVSNLQCFFDQIFGTMLLTLCISAITDPRNMKTPSSVIPIAVGAVVTAIGLSYGLNCGYPINPARDFGPRCLTAMAGWGSAVFSEYDYYFWIPIIAPLLGATLGGWAYLLMVGIHLEAATLEVVSAYPINSIDTKELAGITL